MVPDDPAANTDTRHRAESRLQLMTRTFRALTDLHDLQDTVKQIVRLIKEQVGCDAVGIRLKQGDDFPYFHYQGLDEHFSCSSRGLCSDAGTPAPAGDEGGPVELACRCGAVLQGRIDGGHTCFTAGGSFWSRDLQTSFRPTPAQPLRESCAQAGFESVALIPLRSEGDNVGLLQLYDRRPDYFTAPDIHFLEETGAAIGLAYARERSRLELERRSLELATTNQELVDRNRELDEFTHVASHDLQEPLRSIDTFARFLRRDLGEELPERAARDLGFMVDAATRMGVLIQDLLALSRSGRATIPTQEVELEGCLSDALAALTADATRSGAVIERVALPPTRGNRTLLTTLFQNLIGNAIKFAGDEPPRIRVTLEQGADGPVYGVEDQGTGIEERHQETIFAPFKRVHREGVADGSGIGLAICRKVVERHGGRIWVESTPGQGSHFRFTLQG